LENKKKLLAYKSCRYPVTNLVFSDKGTCAVVIFAASAVFHPPPATAARRILTATRAYARLVFGDVMVYSLYNNNSFLHDVQAGFSNVPIVSAYLI
jgi:hypothetical protein